MAKPVHRRLRGRYGAKLALALLSVIALVVAFGVVVHFQVQDELRNDVRGELTRTAETRATTLDAWIENARTGARITSDHPVFRSGDPGRIRAHLEGLIEDGEVPAGVVAVHYYDTRERRVVASSRRDVAGAPVPADLPQLSPDETYVSEPFEVRGSDAPMVAVVSPAVGRPDMAVAYTVDLNRRLRDLGGGGDRTTVVVNTDGKYVLHPDPGRVLEGSGDRPHEGERSGPAFARDGNRLVGSAPLETKDWVVRVRAPRGTAYALGGYVTSRVLGLILLAVVSLALVGVTVGSNTTIALRQLSRKADRMADGDLDVEFGSPRRDEFGTLVESFAGMRDSLRDSLAEAEEARERAESERRAIEERTEHLEAKATDYEEVLVAAAGGDLSRRVDPESESEAMRAIGEAINETLAELQRTVANVKGFAGHVADATDRVQQGTAAARDATAEVTDAARDIADGARSQTDRIADVSEEMSTLSASAQEVAATVDDLAETSRRAAEAGEDGRAAAEGALDQMDAIEREADAAVDTIEELDAEMAAIGEVVDVITDIADQTDMLAVNASIEAARTDEGGEGFAVVADEVKALAEETKRSAAEIEERIETVQERTGETVERIRETSDRVSAGVTTVEGAIESLERVAALAEEIDTGVQEIATATDEQAESTAAVVDALDEVSGISERTTDEAEGVVSAAEGQGDHLREVGGDATDLADRTAALTDLLDGFAVDADGSVGDTAPAPNAEVAGDD